MRLQALALGYALDVWKPRTGVVHSAFDHAVNVLIDGELWTLLDASRPDAPFGIRLAPGDRPGGTAVATGDRVHVRAGFIGVGPRCGSLRESCTRCDSHSGPRRAERAQRYWQPAEGSAGISRGEPLAGHVVVDCRAASRWEPMPWAHPAAGIDARLFTLQRMMRPRAWSESAAMADDVTAALCESGLDSDSGLANAVRRTIGRGPGLTPAGDDVLVGILTVLASGTSGPAGARATSRLVQAIAPLLPLTSDISRHLLNQAARGLTGRALHDLGKALIEGAPDNILTHAVELVLDTGCTSGADAGMGLAAACHHSFLGRRAAA